MHKAKNIIHFMPFLYHFNKHSVCRGSPMTTNIYIYIYMYIYIYIYIGKQKVQWHGELFMNI